MQGLVLQANDFLWTPFLRLLLTSIILEIISLRVDARVCRRALITPFITLA